MFVEKTDVFAEYYHDWEKSTSSNKNGRKICHENCGLCVFNPKDKQWWIICRKYSSPVKKPNICPRCKNILGHNKGKPMVRYTKDNWEQ